MKITAGWWILIVIISTAFASVCDGSLAYFPIEISRMATGPVSYWIFLCGMIITCFLVPPKLLMASFGLLMLAVFDDVNHWGMHMIGVGVMALGILAAMLRQQSNYELAGYAALIYVTRIMLKVLLTCDPLKDYAWHQLGGGEPPIIYFIYIFISQFNLARCVNQVKSVNYAGSDRSIEQTIYELGGIGQWIAFYLLWMACTYERKNESQNHSVNNQVK